MAHGDLDGLASAAVIVAALRASKGVSPRLLIAQPYALHSVLLKLLSAPPKLVVITDIGIDAASWPSVLTSLRALLEKGARVLWVDHHVQTARHSLELSELGASLLYTSCGCASTIAREVFAPLTDDPSFFSKLARLGEIADHVVQGDKDETLLADRIAAALSAPSSKDEFKLRLVKMWVEERKLVNDEVALKAEEFERELARRLPLVEGKVVFEGERGVLIDARDASLGGLAGHIASQLARRRGKAVVIVFAPNEREVVAVCRVPPHADFDAVKELERIAKSLGGGGGGVPKAAAVRVPSSASDALLSKIRDVLAGAS